MKLEGSIIETGALDGGVYIVTDVAPGGLVTVFSTDGTKATQAGDLSPRQVAGTLLRR